MKKQILGVRESAYWPWVELEGDLEMYEIWRGNEIRACVRFESNKEIVLKFGWGGEPLWYYGPHFRVPKFEVWTLWMLFLGGRAGICKFLFFFFLIIIIINIKTIIFSYKINYSLRLQSYLIFFIDKSTIRSYLLIFFIFTKFLKN